MQLKHKALVLNFIGFATIFIFLRWFVMDFFSINHLLKSILSAILATILSPKFAVIKARDGLKLVMKWVFIKGFKEL
tara:strand:- start:8694 stop:8924 length:231 start_codon:yes stop_codon:yes gene_type:complete